MAFVYASFYLVQQQRPVDEENIVAIGSTLLDIFVAGSILFVGAALGDRICRWLGVRFEHAGETLVWSTSIGLGAIAFGVLGIGLLGWLAGWAIVSLLVVCALVSLSSFPAIGQAVASLKTVARPGKGLSVYLAGMLLLTLLATLTPPLDWDGLFYHLTIPRLYIEQGRIAPVTDMPHQHFPGLMEMLYTAALLLKGEAAAKLLHLAYLLLLGGGVYLLAQRCLRVGDGWLAVTAFASMPMVFVLGNWAYNDLALAFYQVAALYALFCWFRGKPAPWLGLSGAFCGLAMGLKYTSFVCPLTIVVLICWHLARERAPWPAWWRALLAFGGTAALVAAPWYVRNLAFTGNPVYPFAYGLFGGAGWDEWRAAWYARAGSGLGWDVGELLKLPWTLTLGLYDMNFYDGRAGPLLLLGLPFLAAWTLRLFGHADSRASRLAPRGARPRTMGYLIVFALVQYVFWAMGVISSRSLFQSRLLLPAFTALCAPMAYVYGELRALDTRFFSLRRLIGMSVVLVLVANMSYQLIYVLRIRPLPVLVGEESREVFLTRTLGAHYAAMQLVNERVPVDGRVLFLWEPRSYYCRRAVQPDAILERWAWLRHQHGDDLPAIARRLNREGYAYVLLHRAGLELVREAELDPLADADFDALETFIDTFLREEGAVREAYELYRLDVASRDG
jgi:4-amino-4-deoxy-L-arabinose transferase-like glycosyltransferase